MAFVGITLVITRQVDDHDPGVSRRAIGHFLVGFLSLSVAALEYGIASGYDPNPDEAMRPLTSIYFATIPLVLGTIQLLAGLCYLILDFAIDSAELERLSISCNWSYSLMAVLATYYTVDTAGLTLTEGYARRGFESFWLWGPAALAAVVAALLGPPARKWAFKALGCTDSWFNEKRWYSSRKLATVAIIASVLGFVVAGSQEQPAEFVSPGAWADHSPVAILALIAITGLSTISVLVLNGWVVYRRFRSFLIPES